MTGSEAAKRGNKDTFDHYLKNNHRICKIKVSLESTEEG